MENCPIHTTISLPPRAWCVSQICCGSAGRWGNLASTQAQDPSWRRPERDQTLARRRQAERGPASTSTLDISQSHWIATVEKETQVEFWSLTALLCSALHLCFLFSPGAGSEGNYWKVRCMRASCSVYKERVKKQKHQLISILSPSIMAAAWGFPHMRLLQSVDGASGRMKQHDPAYDMMDDEVIFAAGMVRREKAAPNQTL